MSLVRKGKEDRLTLEETEKDTTDGEVPPLLAERHTNHDNTKAKDDEAEPVASANLAQNDVGGEFLLVS